MLQLILRTGIQKVVDELRNQFIYPLASKNNFGLDICLECFFNQVVKGIYLFTTSISFKDKRIQYENNVIS